MNKLMKIIIGVCVLMPMLMQGRLALGQAQDTSVPFDPGQLSFGGRFSENVQEFSADALVPVWKPGASMLFANLRGSFVENDEQQLSAGLVARHLLDAPPLILGLNAYADRRWTEYDNRFNQVGAGLEILSAWVDLRANYYYPLTDEKKLCQATTTTTSVSGGQQRTTTTLMQKYEEALEGYDVEIGVWLPYLSRWIPTALFAGYYDYASDFENGLSGVRLRVESRIYRYITLDAEWFEDKAFNRSDYVVGVRLHIPFHFGGDRRPGIGTSGWRGDAFASRMGDRVIRRQISTIKTGPVVAGETVEVLATSSSPPVAPAPEPPPVEPEPEPPPVEPEPEPLPNCYLDAEGEVVCD